MEITLSKAQFKPRVLEFLREVERSGVEVIITDRGRPVARIVPYEQNHEHLLATLRGSIVEFVEPMEPVGVEQWEAMDDPA